MEKELDEKLLKKLTHKNVVVILADNKISNCTNRMFSNFSTVEEIKKSMIKIEVSFEGDKKYRDEIFTKINGIKFKAYLKSETNQQHKVLCEFCKFERADDNRTGTGTNKMFRIFCIIMTGKILKFE